MRPNCSSGASVSPIVFPFDLDIFSLSGAEQERRRQGDLGLEAVGLHDVAAREQVVELVGAAQLDVRLDRDRVVGLHERVEELGDRDRLIRRVALREVVALEQARHGGRSRQAQHRGEVELAQPFAVEAHLEPRRVVVDEELRLLEVALRVRVDLLVGEHRPLGGPTRRVADPGRVVADDEHPDVAGVLERPHALERDRVTDVHLGGGDVDPELHPERPSEPELALELTRGEHVDGVARQALDRRRHSGRC